MLGRVLRHLFGRTAPKPVTAIAANPPGQNLLTASNGFNRCVLAREGYVVYNKNDIYIGRAMECYGEYCEIEAAMLREFARPGSVVIEVGANIGTHTQVLARAVGISGFVYAYEPQRILFQALCANLALNSTINVDARCMAVGAEPGHVLIPDIDYSVEGNYGGVEVSRFTEGRKIFKVSIDTDLDLARLDLIKIDVEGMELEVITGAEETIRKFEPVLYVENDRREKSESLIRKLFQLNYRLFWHMPPLFNPGNYYNVRDNVYGNVVSLNMLCLPRDSRQKADGLEEITDPSEPAPVFR